MTPWEMWAWVTNGVIHVAYSEIGYIEAGRRPDSWVKHNTRTGTTTGSVRCGSFNELLDASNALYQWLVQDPQIERRLGLV